MLETWLPGRGSSEVLIALDVEVLIKAKIASEAQGSGEIELAFEARGSSDTELASEPRGVGGDGACARA